MKDKIRMIVYDVAFRAGMKGVTRQTDASSAYDKDVQTILDTLIEEVGGLRKGEFPNGLFNIHYNAALMDVINLLKGDKHG